MLVSLFLATCNTEQSRASSKIDFYEKYEYYELRIKNTPWLKRWAKGSEESPRVSRFKGYPLKDILVKLLNVDPFRVEMRRNRVNPKLDFKFESYSSDKEEWIEKIIKVLGKQLNFSIYEEMIKKEVWTIPVSDSALLHNHKTALEGRGSKSTKWFFSKWKGSNQSIDELARSSQINLKKSC